MHKLTLATVAALLSLGASAMAETQNWNITEENTVGIKNAQGVWTVNVEGGQNLRQGPVGRHQRQRGHL